MWHRQNGADCAAADRVLCPGHGREPQCRNVKTHAGSASADTQPAGGQYDARRPRHRPAASDTGDPRHSVLAGRASTRSLPRVLRLPRVFQPARRAAGQRARAPGAAPAALNCWTGAFPRSPPAGIPSFTFGERAVGFVVLYVLQQLVVRLETLAEHLVDDRAAVRLEELGLQSPRFPCRCRCGWTDIRRTAPRPLRSRRRCR